jgi:hypothetical protein
MSAHSSVDSFGSDPPFDNETGSSLHIEINEGEFRILERTLSPGDDADDKCKISVDGATQTTVGTTVSVPLLVTSLHRDQIYGNKLSEEEALRIIPPGDDGLVWYAIVVPDNFISRGKLIGGLNKRDFNLDDGTIKPRRASLPVTMSQLTTSLTKVVGPQGPRYIFNGVLNGWPSLRNFELIELEKKRSLGPLHALDYMNSLSQTWSRYLSVNKEGKDGISPAIKDNNKVYRAKLRGAPWTSTGWSPSSPGFLFWFEAHRPEGPRVVYGIDTVREVGNDICTKVSEIYHRSSLCCGDFWFCKPLCFRSSFYLS